MKIFLKKRGFPKTSQICSNKLDGSFNAYLYNMLVDFYIKDLRFGIETLIANRVSRKVFHLPVPKKVKKPQLKSMKINLQYA